MRGDTGGPRVARCYTGRTMTQLIQSILEQVRLSALVDIGITALLLYWLFVLIRGPRAGHGALIVLERDTGLEEIAETGIMVHGDLTVDLLETIFMPRTALHDGAVLIRDASVLAAGALLPLAETTVHTERFGTRHRA